MLAELGEADRLIKSSDVDTTKARQFAFLMFILIWESCIQQWHSNVIVISVIIVYLS